MIFYHSGGDSFPAVQGYFSSRAADAHIASVGSILGVTAQVTFQHWKHFAVW